MRQMLQVVVAVTRWLVSGATTLTITAEAEGYTSATTSVRVDVIERLSIVSVSRLVLDLVQEASTQISVRVSRIEGSEVTVEIDASAGLIVASSVLLTNTDELEVAVTATDTDVGIATLTFTAEGYTTATVTVDIIEVTEPPQPEPLPIELEVVPGAVEIVTDESTKLKDYSGGDNGNDNDRGGRRRGHY